MNRSIHVVHYLVHFKSYLFNRSSRRKRGMVSNPLFIIPDSFFPFLQIKNAKKNTVFHFGVGRHASFLQKPVVKVSLKICITSFRLWCWRSFRHRRFRLSVPTHAFGVNPTRSCENRGCQFWYVKKHQIEFCKCLSK